MTSITSNIAQAANQEQAALDMQRGPDIAELHFSHTNQQQGRTLYSSPAVCIHLINIWESAGSLMQISTKHCIPA